MVRTNVRAARACIRMYVPMVRHVRTYIRTYVRTALVCVRTYVPLRTRARTYLHTSTELHTSTYIG